jgi:hypothetical protein
MLYFHLRLIPQMVLYFEGPCKYSVKIIRLSYACYLSHESRYVS